MQRVRCPNCGSPVMIQGNRWECGWCGDFGAISSLRSSEKAKIKEALHQDLDRLERGTLSVLEGMQQGLESEEEGRLPACQMVLHGMSKALIPLRNQSSEKLQGLQTFFQRYTFCTAAEVLEAARSGKPAFQALCQLSKQEIGTLWVTLLGKLPPDRPDAVWPAWMNQIVEGLSQIESVFSGEEPSAVSLRMQETLKDHWKRQSL